MKKFILGTFLLMVIIVSVFLCLYIFQNAKSSNLGLKTNSPKLLTDYHDGDFLTLYSNNTKLNLEVARSNQRREEGLMNRMDTLNENEGMIFVFDKPSPQTFWMKNTFIPLDIIFLDSNLKVINIAKSTKINQTDEVYSSNSSSQYVIEMNSGWADTSGLKSGESFSISQ